MKVLRIRKCKDGSATVRFVCEPREYGELFRLGMAIWLKRENIKCRVLPPVKKSPGTVVRYRMSDKDADKFVGIALVEALKWKIEMEKQKKKK